MDLIQLAVPFFVLAMGLEFLYGKFRGRQSYRLNDTINSLSLGVVSTIMELLRLSFASVVFANLVAWLGIPQWSMSSLWQWILAFVAYDACYYWKHRYGHECRIFWASHVAHHQSEEYNLSTALRQTGTDYVGFVFYIPLYLAGLPAAAVITVGSLNLIYQFWVHTKHIGQLGPLEWVFITPSNHRVHHARNPEYLDKNYGGVFVIWDRLFGSYQSELADKPCVYGITTGLHSWNPVWANLHVWVETGRLAWRTRRWRDKFVIWFKAPGWLPEDIEASPAVDWQAEKYDPPVSLRTKVYAFVQFWVVTALSIWTLAVQSELPGLMTLWLFFWMLFSLWVLGALLENKAYAFSMEVTRIVACLGSAAALAATSWSVYPELISAGFAYATFSAFVLLLQRPRLSAAAAESRLVG